MGFKKESVLVFAKGTYIALAALAATLLVLSGAFFSPARAQNIVRGDENNVNDQENVCSNIVAIIIENVQNPDTDNDISSDVNAVNNQNAGTGDGNTTGDVSNEQAVEVSNEQVVDIAQELNISPVIVQNCIQQNAGDDAVIVNEDDDDNNGNKDDDNGGNKDVDDQNPVDKQDGVVDDVRTDRLPVTGGPDLVARGVALSMAVSAAVLSASLLVKSRRRRT